MLDNQTLVDTLEEAKATSNVIAAHLQEAEETNAQINIARDDYRVVATRGHILYFVMASLSNINDMYQYSLEFFKQLFQALPSVHHEPLSRASLTLLALSGSNRELEEEQRRCVAVPHPD